MPFRQYSRFVASSKKIPNDTISNQPSHLEVPCHKRVQIYGSRRLQLLEIYFSLQFWDDISILNLTTRSRSFMFCIEFRFDMLARLSLWHLAHVWTPFYDTSVFSKFPITYSFHKIITRKSKKISYFLNHIFLKKSPLQNSFSPTKNPNKALMHTRLAKYKRITPKCNNFTPCEPLTVIVILRLALLNS